MKNIISEFKTFIERGNVIDLAVGVVVGSAFSGIVNSIVNDILMPFIGIILGGLDFSNLSFKIVHIMNFLKIYFRKHLMQ